MMTLRLSTQAMQHIHAMVGHGAAATAAQQRGAVRNPKMADEGTRTKKRRCFAPNSHCPKIICNGDTNDDRRRRSVLRACAKDLLADRRTKAGTPCEKQKDQRRTRIILPGRVNQSHRGSYIVPMQRIKNSTINDHSSMQYSIIIGTPR